MSNVPLRQVSIEVVRLEGVNGGSEGIGARILGAPYRSASRAVNEEEDSNKNGLSEASTSSSSQQTLLPIAPASNASSDSGDSFVFDDDLEEEEQTINDDDVDSIDNHERLWDSWTWPTIRSEPMFCKEVREAAETLLASVLATGYLYTGDTCPSSACYTHPTSSAGGTPGGYPYLHSLGLAPVQLLLNVSSDTQLT